jgi:hypothetical protein
LQQDVRYKFTAGIDEEKRGSKGGRDLECAGMGPDIQQCAPGKRTTLLQRFARLRSVMLIPEIDRIDGASVERNPIVSENQAIAM